MPQTMVGSPAQLVVPDLTVQVPRLFQSSRGVIWAIFVFSGISNLLLLTAPLYSTQLFDRVLSSGSFETLVMISLMATGGVIFYGIFDYLRTRLLVRLAANLECEFSGRVLNQELAASGKHVAGEGRPTQDLQELSQYLASPSFVGLLDAPWCPLFVLVIFALHPLLGWIALAAAAVLFGLGVVSDRITRAPMTKARALAGIQNEMANQFRRSAELARAMGLVPNIVARWQTLGMKTTVANLNSGDRVGAMSSLARFLRTFVQMALMGAGITLVLKQELTPGIVFASSLLLSRALAPVEQSIVAVRAFGNARSAYDRLTNHLARFEAEAAKMQLADPRGAIEVENVTVSVEGRKTPILDEVSFKIAPGEIVAVIGPSGSGKSTLVRVLAGLLPTTAGTVRVDGVKLADWPSQQLGDRVGYLPQDVELVTGTIAENISGLDPNAQHETILAAAEAASLTDLVADLPQGFNTVIGTFGVALSGGQRQRVGLARALHGDRRILLLDEPDAHLDDVGQQHLASSIRAAKERGTTVVFTTHRRSMLAVSDKVLVMTAGRVSRFCEAVVLTGPTQPAPAKPSASSPLMVQTGQNHRSPQPRPPASPQSARVDRS
jgi:PrtD family type I secretion system ABC transporter